MRSGAITPQTKDEEKFREDAGLEAMTPEALEAWKKDGGVRRPVTLKSQTQNEAEVKE